jgi:RNA polymerase sigma-54 factor
MALSQKLVQKQAQTITLSQQLRQAIELLELSHLDLQTYCEQAALENPFLDIEQEQGTDGPSEGEGPLEGAEVLEGDQAPEHTAPEEAPYEALQSEEYDNVWTSDGSTPHKNSELDSTLWALENVAAAEISLRDHLQSQINTDIDNEQDRLIAGMMLECLHETGYLQTPLATIAHHLNTSVERIEKVLKSLQQFDPCGIFARSLRECMELQLADQGLLDSKIRLVLEYLDLYAEARIEELLKKVNCSPEELKLILEKIKLIDPKPGLKFSNQAMQTRTPDVFVTWDPQEKGWIVTLNAETLPRVLVTQDYQQRVKADFKKDRELRKYYQERMAAANWLVRALDQRAQNILKVVREIVQQQQAFFAKGVDFLRPMRLKDVAEAVGIHESTVSRVTQNKYLSCPRGIFELRYFFSASITNAWTGEDQSALQIQHKIHELIKTEDPKKPLSDDLIVRHLSEFNLDVARRTVAKYRELLSIPSSYERKRRYLRQLS